MAHPLAAKWEQKIYNFLVTSADSITVYYKPVRTGQDVTFDTFFQEGTDPADPSDFENITNTTPTEITVSRGKTHLDMYGNSIGGSEGEQQLDIGKFPESDAWFQCLLSDVQTSTNPAPIETIFDNFDDIVKYVVVAKDGKRYDIVAVKLRGMGASPYVVDVFLKRTNKEI